MPIEKRYFLSATNVKKTTTNKRTIINEHF